MCSCWLFNWCEYSGIPAEDFTPCCRGLVAARSLRQGDVAIAVPLCCAWTVSKSHASLLSARKGGTIQSAALKTWCCVSSGMCRQSCILHGLVVCNRVIGNGCRHLTNVCRHLTGALGTLLSNLDAALAACGRLLPGDTRNVLVMALGLLAELRDPKSAARPALRMLPAPPGSPLAAVCADGQPATDLLMFR
jgi:hypothetical protein